MTAFELLAILPKPAAVVSRRGDVRFANVAFAQLLGRAARDPAALTAALAARGTLLRGFERAAARLRRAGASTAFEWSEDDRSFRLHVTRADDERFVVVVDDLSHHVELGKLQGLARQYLETVVNHLTAGVMVLDERFRVTFLNERQRTLVDELQGRRSIVDLIGAVAAEVSPLFSADEWRAIAEQVAERGESVVHSRRPYPLEHPDRYFLITIVPHSNGSGRRSGAVCVTEDITRLVRLESELVRREQIALVGQMAIALNHEINNPLTVIVGNAEALLASADATPTGSSMKAVLRAAARIADVTSRLRRLEEIHLTEYIKDGPLMLDLGRGGSGGRGDDSMPR